MTTPPFIFSFEQFRENNNFFNGPKRLLFIFKGENGMEINVIIKIDGHEVINITENTKTKKETKGTVSEYARFFDASCMRWTKDSEFNLTFLKQQEHYANERLRIKGHLFLNEVYDMLDITRTKAGQVVGWIYDEKNPIGDNRVDFGINDDRNKDFVNGNENTILLDFNVDGNILDLL